MCFHFAQVNKDSRTEQWAYATDLIHWKKNLGKQTHSKRD